MVFFISSFCLLTKLKNQGIEGPSSMLDQGITLSKYSD
jgi:hypothetical protein